MKLDNETLELNAKRCQRYLLSRKAELDKVQSHFIAIQKENSALKNDATDLKNQLDESREVIQRLQSQKMSHKKYISYFLLPASIDIDIFGHDVINL